jgi:hypothetical protein
MSKTAYSSKTNILAELFANYKDSGLEKEGWREFFTYYDFTLTLSYFESMGWITIKNEEAAKGITETWDALCNMLSISDSVDYKNLSEMFDESQNV